MVDKIQFRARHLEEEIEKRHGASPSATAKRDLDRYYTLIRESQPLLEQNEMLFVIFSLVNVVTDNSSVEARKKVDAVIARFLGKERNFPALGNRDRLQHVDAFLNPSALRNYLWVEVVDGYETFVMQEINLEGLFKVKMRELTESLKKLSVAKAFAVLDLAEIVWAEWLDPECCGGSEGEPETAALERNWRWFERSQD